MKKIVVLLLLFNIVVFAQQKGSFTDPRDRKKYKTVKIGVQTWMAEDLKYAPGGECYNNDIDYCKKYGRLYLWGTAIKVCPSGWHLPSYDEWDILVDFVGGDNVAGKKLKAKSRWNSDGNGDGAFGFSALPGGYGNSDGSFNNVGYDGSWWSATEDDSSNAYSRYMGYDYENAYWSYYDKYHLFSVRCLQD
jgi:uncharacterized protein (TIGR02145 family)